MRMKIHETKPLFVEDAVEQMSLIGDDFYFLLNQRQSGQSAIDGPIAGRSEATA